MEELTWQSLAGPTSTVAVVTLMLTICKAALPGVWRPLINGILALVFGVAVSIGVTAGIGAATGGLADPVWATYLLAGLNGIICAGAVLGVTTRYDAKIPGGY
jgi:hypothetical protein